MPVLAVLRDISIPVNLLLVWARHQFHSAEAQEINDHLQRQALEIITENYIKSSWSYEIIGEAQSTLKYAYTPALVVAERWQKVRG